MSYGADNLEKELKKIANLADEAIEAITSDRAGDCIRFLEQIKEIAGVCFVVISVVREEQPYDQS